MISIEKKVKHRVKIFSENYNVDFELSEYIVEAFLKFLKKLEYNEKMTMKLFDKCLIILKSEKSLTLIKNEEYTKFMSNLSFFLLSHYHMPFLLLDSLSSSVKEYISYLQNNESQLLETGYPKSRFMKSSFLPWEGDLLYPVCEPSDINIITSDNGNEIFEYLWEGSIKFDVINEKILKLFINSREKVFSIKLKIMGIILKHLEKPEELDLCDKCLANLHDKFIPYEFNTLLQCEKYYDKINKKMKNLIPINQFTVGGIRNLIFIIAYFNEQNKLIKMIKNDNVFRKSLYLDKYLNPVLNIKDKDDLIRKITEIDNVLIDKKRLIRNHYFEQVYKIKDLDKLKENVEFFEKFIGRPISDFVKEPEIYDISDSSIEKAGAPIKVTKEILLEVVELKNRREDLKATAILSKVAEKYGLVESTIRKFIRDHKRCFSNYETIKSLKGSIIVRNLTEEMVEQFWDNFEKDEAIKRKKGKY